MFMAFLSDVVWPKRDLCWHIPVCWCGVTPTSRVSWRTQGRRRSAPACPCCVWKVCSGSSQLVSSAIQTGWPSSSPPWVRHAQFPNRESEQQEVITFCVSCRHLRGQRAARRQQHYRDELLLHQTVSGALTHHSFGYSLRILKITSKHFWWRGVSHPYPLFLFQKPGLKRYFTQCLTGVDLFISEINVWKVLSTVHALCLSTEGSVHAAEWRGGRI